MKQLIISTIVVGLVLLVAGAANAKPDYCGSSEPVEIYIYEPAYCDNVIPRCLIKGDKNDGYGYLCTPSKDCVTKDTQEWTDYPECGGKQIVSHGGGDTMTLTSGTNAIWLSSD